MSGVSQMTLRDHEPLRGRCVQSQTDGGQQSTIMHRGRIQSICMEVYLLFRHLRYKGEMSSSKLQSSRLYQSAPDLMYSEYLEQGLSRSSRTMSLCNKFVESCFNPSFNLTVTSPFTEEIHTLEEKILLEQIQ